MPRNRKAKERQKKKKEKERKEKEKEEQENKNKKNSSNNNNNKNNNNNNNYNNYSKNNYNNKNKKGKKKKKNINYEFKKELKSLGYYIKEVEGDGNCLFRSVCEQLEGNEDNHKKYREICIEYMKSHKEDFEPFIEDDQTFDDYVEEMSKDKEWGGNLEIYALSKALQVNFYIYIYEHPLYIVKNFEEPKHNLILTYHEGKHYNSLRKLEEKTEEENSSDDEENEDDNSHLDNVNNLIKNVEHLNI
jgi:OTU domain-containing protein 3